MTTRSESRGREHEGDRSHADYHRLVPPPCVRSDPHLEAIVTALLTECREAIAAILLFGSRLVRSDPDRHSAYDLLIVTGEYSGLYRALSAAGRLHRSPVVFTLLSHVMPPTNLSYRIDPESPDLAKCMVLDRKHLERALSESAPDHFCLGRLVQHVALLHARTPEARQEVIEILAAGRRTALSWVAPFVEDPFSVEEFTRTMLAVCFGGEIRPESEARPKEVSESQDRYLRCVYGRLLDEAGDEGILVVEGDRFRYADPPSALERLRWRAYFRWSRLRSTARWFKHMLTFEEWLDYIRHKVERRMGLRIELTRLDRKYPLVFLWPKLFRVLRARKRRGSGDEDAD